MDMSEAREKAAQAWCHPSTSHLVMDAVLCAVFADILHDVVRAEQQRDRLEKALIALTDQAILIGHNDICDIYDEFPDPDLPCNCTLAPAITMAQAALRETREEGH